MPRPPKCRRVEFLPDVTYFKPAGIPLRALEEVRLSVEEAEAIRLKDLEGLEQEQCAERMNISRPTFQRVLASGRQKMADALLNTADELLSQCNFKQALKTIMAVAHETNRYLDEKSPWKVIKDNRQVAAISLYVAICVISRLKTALYPFLPFSSQKVHEFLGFEGNVEDDNWQPHMPEPGQRLRKPQPLFSKLEDSLVEEETKRLGQAYH